MSHKLMPLAAVLLAGCMTFDQSEFPRVSFSRAPEGKDIAVEVAGFSAQVTTYLPSYGYTTVYEAGPSGRGRRRAFWGARTYTYASTSYHPHVSETPTFRDRATDALESSGFLTRAPNPRYRIAVTFEGPYATNGENMEMFCWSLFSLFTADRGIQSWHARLRIHDNVTGRLLFEQIYAQQYHATAWGLIPFFSPAAAGATDVWTMKSWCLTALTDRTIADATAFLTQQKSAASATRSLGVDGK